MTRRLWPLKRAAATPGSTTYAQVQMRGLPQPESQPAAAFTPDIAGPALLPEWRYMMGGVRYAAYSTYPLGQEPFAYYDELPNVYLEHFAKGEQKDTPWFGKEYWYEGGGAYIAYVKVGENSINHGSGYELPAAQWSEDGRMTRCWVNLGEIKRPLRFRAVLLGRAMRDVQWTANLDTSMPWPAAWRKSLGELWPGGVDVEDEGHSLLIRVHPGTGPQNAGNWAAALTMTASAGGKDVGTLTLHMGWRTKPLAQQLQEDLYDFTGWEGWKPADTQESV